MKPRRDSTVMSERFDRSIKVFEDGKRYLPGGVSSPIRTFHEVESPPLVFSMARGARMHDIDGNEYLDFMCALGPLILGHCAQVITEAMIRQIDHGTVYATPTEIEYQLAEKIIESTPCLEQMRFVCSGTEAVMTAVRLARAATGKEKLVKFCGSYHGHADALMGKRDPHLHTSAELRRAGFDPGVERITLLIDYNDIDAVRQVFKEQGEEIAAVIVEPYACNMGLVLPEPGFLEELRTCCDRAGALLIFDEVVTGFRFCYGSVANQLGIEPDIVTFGKIIGGGTPIGGYAARREHMKLLEGADGVFQGGTFAGNPLSMAAGVATLAELRAPGFYEGLEELGRTIEDEVKAGFAREAIPYGLVRKGSVGSFVLIEGVTRLRGQADARKQDASLYSRFHLEMLIKGFLLPPSVEEPFFVSNAHTAEDVTMFARAAVEVLAELRRQRQVNG
jgi:glutamate-1-semialdehyde 2,1-aminomutase